MGDFLQFKSPNDPELRGLLLKEVTAAITERGRLDNMPSEMIAKRIEAAMGFVDAALNRPMLRGQEPVALAVSEQDTDKIHASHLDLSCIIVGSLLRHFLDALPGIVGGRSRA